MSYELIVRREAQSDIQEIVRWYEKKERGLGNYFLLCLDASFESLKLVKDNKIYIDVVEPFSRNPSRLKERLKKG